MKNPIVYQSNLVQFVQENKFIVSRFKLVTIKKFKTNVGQVLLLLCADTLSFACLKEESRCFNATEKVRS